MILGALKWREPRRFNAPKIIKKLAANPELWLIKHRCDSTFIKSDPCTFYYRKSYCKKCHYFKKWYLRVTSLVIGLIWWQIAERHVLSRRVIADCREALSRTYDNRLPRGTLEVWLTIAERHFRGRMIRDGTIPDPENCWKSPHVSPILSYKPRIASNIIPPIREISRFW